MLKRYDYSLMRLADFLESLYFFVRRPMTYDLIYYIFNRYRDIIYSLNITLNRILEQALYSGNIWLIRDAMQKGYDINSIDRSYFTRGATNILHNRFVDPKQLLEGLLMFEEMGYLPDNNDLKRKFNFMGLGVTKEMEQKFGSSFIDWVLLRVPLVRI